MNFNQKKKKNTYEFHAIEHSFQQMDSYPFKQLYRLRGCLLQSVVISVHWTIFNF